MSDGGFCRIESHISYYDRKQEEKNTFIWRSWEPSSWFFFGSGSELRAGLLAFRSSDSERAGRSQSSEPVKKIESQSQIFHHGAEMGADFEKFREPEPERLSLLVQLPIQKKKSCLSEVFSTKSFVVTQKKFPPGWSGSKDILP